MFDGRVVHGTGANRTADKMRHGILAYHCRAFMRQQENPFLGLDPAVIAEGNEELLARLGYTIQYGLGRIEKPGQQGLLTDLGAPIVALDATGKPYAAETGLPAA